MDAFDALADITRRRILRTLAQGPRTAGELAAGEPHSRPAVSRHLRVLRESGLVRSDLRGRTRVYTFAPDGLTAVRELLVSLDDTAAQRHPSPPIPAERLDALDLEVRRTGRERRADARREDIA